MHSCDHDSVSGGKTRNPPTREIRKNTSLRTCLIQLGFRRSVQARTDDYSTEKSQRIEPKIVSVAHNFGAANSLGPEVSAAVNPPCREHHGGDLPTYYR